MNLTSARRGSATSRIRARARGRLRTCAVVAMATILVSLAGCGSAAPKPVGRSGGTTSLPRVSSSGAPASDIAAAVNAGAGMAVSLLQRLGHAGGNLVFSPYSIETALSMVEAGARGSTASEIARVLHTSQPDAVAAGLAAIDARLPAAPTGPDAPTLHLANGLWLQSGLSLERPFADTLASLFGAPPQSVDFSGAPDTARQAINSWVANHTANRIPDLFPAGTITSQTVAVLANATYLAAHWADPFARSQTSSRPFHTAAGSVVRVPFMTQAPVPLPYTRRRTYQAVDLPYLHSSLSMLLVMPSPGTLARFERGLSSSSLTLIARRLAPVRLDLHMPRFHLSFDTELNPVLSELGMPVAFSDGADFSGIVAQPPLKISAVEHAADLRVDESGTVAAAATGISIEPTAVVPEPATRLTLDHPFLAFLRDNSTGTILFTAQVTNPAAGS